MQDLRIVDGDLEWFSQKVDNASEELAQLKMAQIVTDVAAGMSGSLSASRAAAMNDLLTQSMDKLIEELSQFSASVLESLRRAQATEEQMASTFSSVTHSVSTSAVTAKDAEMFSRLAQRLGGA
ncbi:hypothetical protein [Schaalia sp. Marseille-Q2122]|uniref:hypothetical protein n=1 Tax=Schaalia sp. Marseille-Q2122 TaxID=2736604 RepID=UPI00158E4D25|nr:hypothetical protein [Schaalia sp. Marseille-Q2122]